MSDYFPEMSDDELDGMSVDVSPFTAVKGSNGHHAEEVIPEQPPAFDDEFMATVGSLAERKNGHKPMVGRGTAVIPTPGAFKCDDIGNGERLACRHGARLRHVKEWGWLVWNNFYWEQDRGNVAMLAKETARSIFAEAAAAEDDTIAKALANHAKATASRSRREAMVDACASEPGIPAAPKDFDRDPWLLNVQNGVLNLRTGELQPHDPQALLTKMAGTEYHPEATCPTWEAFLQRIFKGDKEVITFIQRAVGYSLTGNIGEQCLFFLHGTGKNGKSTFTGTLQALAGDYSSKTLTDTLMVKYYDGGINNDLARLAGARAVIAAELEEGKRLNESLVKDLTGGDTITARYLHREYFEFMPAFKLWMYGNHKPIIRGTDEGIWRRIKLIPFTVTIPEPERDPDLPEKLKAELPGILAWAVAGCKAWQREGLQTPSEVNAATIAYRAEQDTLAAFLSECCIIGTGYKVTSGELFDVYQKWGGELNRRRFSSAMAERGFVTLGRDGAGRALYHDIGLVEPQDER
jgi:putative DNA primase/helicase